MSRADLIGLLACALGIVLVISLPGGIVSGRPADTTAAPIAEVTFALTGVQRRALSALVWDDLDVGEEIHEADTIFVPDAATASVRFTDGARMTLAPGSMVTLRLSQQSPEIAVARGHLTLESNESTLRVRSSEGVVAVGAASGARISAGEGDTLVEVEHGDISVEASSERRTVTDGQAASFNSVGLKSTTTLAHRLGSPRFGQNVFYLQQPPALRLAWSPPATVGTHLEVARDRAFSEVVTNLSVTGTSQPFKTKAGGVYWWRLVNDGGVAVSGANMFVLVENERPLLLTPTPNATVHSPEGEPIRLVWTECPGARTYEVEIASDVGFVAPLVTATTESNRYVFDAPLADGRYFWRVRVADADRGFSPHSKVQSFWLVQRPILNAPSEVEVKMEPGGVP